MNPIIVFNMQPQLNRVYFEPCGLDSPYKLWQFVDNAVSDSGVEWTQSFNEAVISWMNANYQLPDGYNSIYGDSPGEREASSFNVSNFTFI